jgi:tetrahydromethanopterin S-methyltransferase subunit G
MADREEDDKNKRQDNDISTADKAANMAAGITNNALEGVKNITTDATNKVSEELGEAYKKTAEILNNPNVLYGLVIVIIIAIICIIVIYYFIANAVFNKKSVIIEQTKFPVKGNVNNNIIIENFPASGNGLKRTYTFWIYVNDVNNYPGKAKHIFSIGPNDKSVANKSPVVTLNNSKLYIHFPKANSSIITLDDITKNPLKNTVMFDYLPMQRWVHIGIVIYDNFEGASVSLYMDAQLVSTTTDGETGKTETGTGTDKHVLKDLRLDITGSLSIGGDDPTYPGFNGLLSKVGIYNYDLNSRDIYNIYSEGPIDGLLASIGYGVRAPLYKLSD